MPDSMTRAGLPATSEPAGTSFITTLAAEIMRQDRRVEGDRALRADMHAARVGPVESRAERNARIPADIHAPDFIEIEDVEAPDHHPEARPQPRHQRYVRPITRNHGPPLARLPGDGIQPRPAWLTLR